MNRSKIEWTDYTWNPITGCTRGCPYCYARRMAHRLKGRAGYPKDDPFRPTFHGDRLLEPLKLKKPSKIFTISMGEFFDPKVPDIWRDLLFRVILEAEQHTFQILTKRPGLVPYNFEYEVPSNVWLGVSLDGKTTDSMWGIEEIFQVPAVEVRFVSFEPLLGPVEFDPDLLDWIIVGAQTGPGAKPPRKEWVESIIDTARSAGKPVFLKNNLNWPEKIQESPKVKLLNY